MTPQDAATLRRLRKILAAYLDREEMPATPEGLRAIAGAILSRFTQAEGIATTGLVLERWVAVLVSGFDAEVRAQLVPEPEDAAIAAQARAWQIHLKSKLRDTLDAYIQTQTENVSLQQLSQIAVTVLPLLEDAAITQETATTLIHQVLERFDWQAALGRVIEPQWAVIAAQAARFLNREDVGDTLLEVVRAYIETAQPAIAEIGEGLVESVLQAVLNQQGQLHLDWQLDPETQRVVIKAVSFRLQLMQAAPSPQARDRDIAHQVSAAVGRLRAARSQPESYLPEPTFSEGNQSRSVLGPTLEVGIPLQPSQASAADPEPRQDNEIDTEDGANDKK